MSNLSLHALLDSIVTFVEKSMALLVYVFTLNLASNNGKLMKISRPRKIADLPRLLLLS
jgi:hypothetical protein